MSYLNFPQLQFFGKFQADPSTLNNTPDNYNPNNQFPPANGEEISNNIQLYWNPNGTAEFQLDCTVTRLCYADGTEATTTGQDPLIGLALQSLANDPFSSGKVVDLDPMQQNVTEIWGLGVGILGGDGKSQLLQGGFKPSAYSNAWVQVKGGRGDYAGSANYQSVLESVKISDGHGSKFLDELRELGADPDKLSINFVLRAFNSASQQYQVGTEAVEKMNAGGVSAEAIAAITPLSQLSGTRYSKPRGLENPGKIPTKSYFTKLVKERLAGLNIPPAQVATIIKSTALPPDKPMTPYEFTWGQVYGTIGLPGLPENTTMQPGRDFGPPPDLLAPDRMLTPPAIKKTGKPPVSVPTDTGAFKAYFAPFKVTTYAITDPSDTGSVNKTSVNKTYVSLNLGNSLLSTQPASPTASSVDVAMYGDLALCCLGASNKVLSKINYQDQSFYETDGGILNVPINDEDVDAVQTQPLCVASLDSAGNPDQVFLQENQHGLYVRPNRFVYRMNPGVVAGSAKSGSASGDNPSDHLNPETATVEFYVSRFGQPVSGEALKVNIMPSIEAQTYSNNTLGTGSTTGMVNMSVPVSALGLENGGSITTDSNGIARLQLTASDPGNPRGYMDGQIYFLQYGFDDAALQASYLQSPDDLVSVQVYNEQPDITDITWENFVGPVLSQYAKIYPIMSRLDLGNEKSVIAEASTIAGVLKSNPATGRHMPVTRDMSVGRRKLIVQWLEQQ